ncbi:MAG: MBL fold metallo-hydrolase [Clostridia bacterium]|nr:MBL fold metallo-hydrolase [Clostridia bacterium]
MQLTILGKYGPFPKQGGATSSYLLNCNGKNVLIDMGAGSFSRLIKIVKPEDLDVIVLSHFHFDHTSDVGVLIYYFQSLFNKGYDKKPLVICPDSGGALAESVISCPYFEVLTVSGGEITFHDELSFEIFEMKHPVPTIGVKISDGEKTFAYTGDTNLCYSVDDLFENSDLVLADGAFLRKDWGENLPHLSVEHILEFTEKYGNKSIISHINPKYTQEEIEDVIKNYKNCQLAQEGKTYTI